MEKDNSGDGDTCGLTDGMRVRRQSRRRSLPLCRGARGATSTIIPAGLENGMAAKHFLSARGTPMQRHSACRGLLTAMLLLPLLACAQAPDRILYNGKILTVDQKFSVASAIAIRGERIVAVGETASIRKLAGSSTVQTDLQGRTVVPGLIDNHLHYLRGSNFMPFETRLEGILSHREALEKIAARAHELGPGSGPGKWIFVIGGWHEQQFADKPGGFTQEELDQAAPDNPVYIQKTYSDFYMNSLAI